MSDESYYKTRPEFTIKNEHGAETMSLVLDIRMKWRCFSIDGTKRGIYEADTAAEAMKAMAFSDAKFLAEATYYPPLFKETELYFEVEEIPPENQVEGIAGLCILETEGDPIDGTAANSVHAAMLSMSEKMAEPGYWKVVHPVIAHFVEWKVIDNE